MRRDTNQKKPPHIEHSRPDRISATVPIHSRVPVSPCVQKPYNAAAATRKPATPTKILYSVFTARPYFPAATVPDWFQLSEWRRVFIGSVVVAYGSLPIACIASWV